MNFIASTMPKFPNSSTFRRGISKESEGDITVATITIIDEDEGFGMSSSSLTPIENDTKEQHGTSTRHEEIASTVRDRAEHIIGPIEVSLNDDKGCVHRNEREEQHDERIGKQNLDIKNKRTLYGADAKESHPFFDGRFVEIDGMVQINNNFDAHREIIRQKLRRGRRRQPVLERSSVNA